MYACHAAHTVTRNDVYITMQFDLYCFILVTDLLVVYTLPQGEIRIFPINNRTEYSKNYHVFLTVKLKLEKNA